MSDHRMPEGSLRGSYPRQLSLVPDGTREVFRFEMTDSGRVVFDIWDPYHAGGQWTGARLLTVAQMAAVRDYLNAALGDTRP
ncbi:MAG TPA: hypothetical protein VD948_05110 [Rhodothermales bacterium]|nr:hypothetical protein [Rhodothermales bacterium]